MENLTAKSALFSKRSLRYLAGGVAVLVIVNIVNQILGKPFWTVTRFIHLGSDDNIAAWYSSMLLAYAGFLSYECSVHAKTRKFPGGLPFLVFCGLLFLMSCDEVAQIHETIGARAADYLNISSSSLAQHSSWVWVGGPILVGVFVGVVLWLKKFLTLVPRCTWLLAAGFTAIILGGIFLESTINFLNHDEYQLLWDIEIILEETLEMVGTVLIASSLMVWRDGIDRLAQARPGLLTDRG